MPPIVIPQSIWLIDQQHSILLAPTPHLDTSISNKMFSTPRMHAIGIRLHAIALQGYCLYIEKCWDAAEYHDPMYPVQANTKVTGQHLTSLSHSHNSYLYHHIFGLRYWQNYIHFLHFIPWGISKIHSHKSTLGQSVLSKCIKTCKERGECRVCIGAWKDSIPAP